MNSNLNHSAATKPALILLAATIVLALCFQSRANAQSGYGNAVSVVTCSSNDGNRVYCDANTQGGIRLVRQISGSPCTQGSTWGYDARGIWVDRGCRAEFEIASAPANRGTVTALTCSSNDGNRVYCDANTQGGVRLVRQVSGSPCTQGSTWGYDARGIWVDRGCRAEFEIAGATYPGAGRNANASVSLTCSSNDGRRVYCDTNTQGGVRLVRQLSGSPCTQGATWGYDARGIWVDRGCRAEFEAVTVADRGDRDRGERDRNRGDRDSRRVPSTVAIDPNNNVTWQGQSPSDGVYTQTDGQREVLFAQGLSGAQVAGWIVPGHVYIFILRGANGTEMARTQVDTRGRGGDRGRRDQPGR